VWRDDELTARHHEHRMFGGLDVLEHIPRHRDEVRAQARRDAAGFVFNAQ
jgi:hypothetical protein